MGYENRGTFLDGCSGVLQSAEHRRSEPPGNRSPWAKSARMSPFVLIKKPSDWHSWWKTCYEVPDVKRKRGKKNLTSGTLFHSWRHLERAPTCKFRHWPLCYSWIRIAPAYRLMVRREPCCLSAWITRIFCANIIVLLYPSSHLYAQSAKRIAPLAAWISLSPWPCSLSILSLQFINLS